MEKNPIFGSENKISSILLQFSGSSNRLALFGKTIPWNVYNMGAESFFSILWCEAGWQPRI